MKAPCPPEVLAKGSNELSFFFFDRKSASTKIPDFFYFLNCYVKRPERIAPEDCQPLTKASLSRFGGRVRHLQGTKCVFKSPGDTF